MVKKILLCFFSIYSLSFAEVTLEGIVVDYESGIPLRDANVHILGTKLGDATDLSGSFSIDISDPGSYEIVVSVIGFEEASQIVEIQEGQSKKVRFELKARILELDPVLVLKERSSVVGFGPKFLRIPGSASVVTSRDLAKYNDTDINRIITRIPGVYVQEEDGFGLRPNIGMRGTGIERSSKINLMEDGIPIAPAPYSSPAAYYSPTAGRMESFEVRKGSSQIKYGPQSTGGALNYISTSIPRDFRVKANLFGGQFNTYKAHVNIGSSGETFGYLLETFIDQTTGFKNLDHAVQNTGFSKADYLSKFRFNTPKSFTIPAAIELKYSITDELSNETYLGLSRSDFSIDPLRRYAASGIDEMDADHAQTVLTSVVKPLANVDLTFAYYKNEFNRNWYKLSKVGGVSIGSILSSDNNHPAYALLRAEDTSDDVFQIKANNRMYKSTGFQLVANSRFSLLNSYHNLMVGYRDHSDQMDRFQKVDKYAMRSKELVLTTTGIWGTGSKNNRFYYADAISYFIEDEVEAGPFIITVGVRAEDISIERKEWKGDISGEGGSWNDPNRELTPSVKTKKLDVIVPGIGMVYKLNPSLSLISGIHKGFSPPGPGVDEEDDVKPEKSVNLELGFRYRVGLTEIISTIFNNQYQNLLGDDTQYAGSGSYDQFNAGQVNINGLELAASHIIPIGQKFMPLHLSSTEFLNSFESDFEAWGTVMAGDELPYVPKHQLFSEAGLEDRAWSSYIRFRLIDAMRTVAGSGGIDSDFSTDVVVLFDFSAEISISSTSRLFFKMNNIFNNHPVAAARPAGVRPTMPRNIMAGVKIIL